MIRAAGIALRTYLVPLAATRAPRIGLVALIGFLAVAGGVTALGVVSEDLSRNILSELRLFILIPGIPFAAVLLGEMPLRDGIRHRQLLYPLLGPVPRGTLAAVRIVVTGVLLAAMSMFLVLMVALLRREGFENLGQDLMAATLGSFCYIGLFSLIHLINKRGLITSLAFYVLGDEIVGLIPFNLRNISPAFHLRSLIGDVKEFNLPVVVPPDPPSLLISALMLVGVAVVSIALASYLFTRRNLGELC